MKKNKLLLLTALLATTTILAGCNRTPGGGSGGGGTSTPSINPNADVVVNFYLDFNQLDAKNVYTTQTIKNGSTVTRPDTPAASLAPMPEFTVFIGWSKKEIIDNVNDLWNFETDTVETFAPSFNIYGIWVAEGES